MADFNPKVALKSLVLKSNPVEWRQTLDALIDSLPDTLDHSDMSSLDVAGVLLQGLTSPDHAKSTPNYRSANDH